LCNHCPSLQNKDLCFRQLALARAGVTSQGWAFDKLTRGEIRRMGMRKLLVWSCVVALGLFFCLAGSASAVPVDPSVSPVPGSVDPGQNGQNFTLSSGMGFYWTSPNPAAFGYSHITFNNFNTYISVGNEIFSIIPVGGNVATIAYGDFKHWTGYMGDNTATSIAKGGDPISTLNNSLAWNYYLYSSSGVVTYPITFDINYFYYDGSSNIFRGHEHYEITGYSEYNITTGKYDTTQYFPTPLPPSVLLLGSGLLSLGFLGWRRKDG
jgi:hypothetical protein